MDERVEDEDVMGMGRGLEDHGVESSAEARDGEAGGSFDGEGEGEVVGEERRVKEHAGEEEEAEVGLGVGVGADDGVPGVEVWLRYLVEQEEGVRKVAEGREGAGGEELAGGVGVGEEVEAEHVGVDLLQPWHVQGGLVVVEEPQHWMVIRTAVVVVGVHHDNKLLLKLKLVHPPPPPFNIIITSCSFLIIGMEWEWEWE